MDRVINRLVSACIQLCIHLCILLNMDVFKNSTKMKKEKKTGINCTFNLIGIFLIGSLSSLGWHTAKMNLLQPYLFALIAEFRANIIANSTYNIFVFSVRNWQMNEEESIYCIYLQCALINVNLFVSNTWHITAHIDYWKTCVYI